MEKIGEGMGGPTEIPPMAWVCRLISPCANRKCSASRAAREPFPHAVNSHVTFPEPILAQSTELEHLKRSLDALPTMNPTAQLTSLLLGRVKAQLKLSPGVPSSGRASHSLLVVSGHFPPGLL